MQDLKLQTTLPALSFDAEALKVWALSLTEEAVADAKKDMAELNKAKKSIDDARKEAVRRLSEPIRAFEAQPAILPAEPQPTPEPDAPDKVMSVLLTYAPANEQSIRAALEQLKKLYSSFSVRTR